MPWDQPGAVPPALTPPAETPDPACAQSYADDAPKRGPRLEFGIGPRLAGEAGATQTTPVVGEDKRLRDRALLELKGDAPLRVRLNRLFQADGKAGIAEFRRMTRHYASLGIDVELQVRYHPLPEQNGDIAAWLDYVRRVVRAFGPINHVVGLQITNEVNLSSSPNTSDGAYRDAVQALAQGVVAAKREARRRGFDQLTTGFNYAWRFGDGDADFWRAVGAAGGKALRKATDWVGIDAYPGTFVPATVEDPATRCSRGSRRCASATCRWRASAGRSRSTSRRSATRPGRDAARMCRRSSSTTSCAPSTPTAVPTGSRPSTGSGYATTTARGLTSNRSSGYCATITAASPRSPSTAT